MFGQFEIELNFAAEQLANYLHELEVLEAGASYSDLGISARRAASRPGVISFESATPRLIEDPEMLSAEELTPAGSFAHLHLNGVMRANDGMSSRGILSLTRDIILANQNDNIRGILIEAHTGGGEASAGDMLRAAIEGSEKPVVVYAHLLASAGIRGTLPAAEIIASGEGAQFGSIGTYVSLQKNFREWYARNFEDVYADKSTNKNKEFRAYLAGNLEPLKLSVNRTNEYFLKEVRKYRMLTGDVEKTLSGEMFFAREAKKAGLIDGIGNFTYAVRRLAAIADNPQAAATASRQVAQTEEPNFSTEQYDVEMNILNKIRELLNVEAGETQAEEAPATVEETEGATEGSQGAEAVAETAGPDTVEDDTNEEFENRLSEINESISAVRETLTETGQAVALVAEAGRETAEALRALNTRLDAINGRLDTLEGRLADTESAVAESTGKAKRPVVGAKTDAPDFSKTEKAFNEKVKRPANGIQF